MKVWAVALLLLMAAAPPPGATSCSGCHGVGMPIAGRDGPEMTRALIAFRSDATPSTVMGRIAKGFDAAELSAISSWWAARK